MKFGPVASDEAVGCVIAHGTLAGSEKIKKGTRLKPEHIQLLVNSGIEQVIVARLEANDLGEDEAASRIAHAVVDNQIELAGAATGRVNLYAKSNGIFLVDKKSVDGLNRIDPGVTFATLPAFSHVSKGQMVATVKIIPFAVSGRLVENVEAKFADGSLQKVTVAAFIPRKISVISTLLPGLKPSVIDKTIDVLRSRLASSGSVITSDKRIAHRETDLAETINLEHRAGTEMIVIFGASAVVDEEDVIPAAIRLAGGQVQHVGMPVDPGNLLVLGSIENVPVIGAPGCARSPKENGFDYVLNRLLANVPVTPHDITGMGVGGLLMEIASRPQPREGTTAKRKPEIAALVLAAGQSRRSGSVHKLKSTFDGVPLLRRTCETVLASGFASVNVILGFDHEVFAEQLSGLPVPTSINQHFGDGLSTSLKLGVAELPPSVDGVLVMLADMPALTAGDLKALTAAFLRSNGNAVIRATDHGKRGNPVILPRSVFPEIAKLRGDVGAKPIVEGFDGNVVDVEIGAAASLDVDTAEAIKDAGGSLPV